MSHEMEALGYATVPRFLPNALFLSARTAPVMKNRSLRPTTSSTYDPIVTVSLVVSPASRTAPEPTVSPPGGRNWPHVSFPFNKSWKYWNPTEVLELTLGLSWNDAVPIVLAVQLKMRNRLSSTKPCWKSRKSGPSPNRWMSPSTRCVTSAPTVARPDSHGSGRQSPCRLPVNRSTSCVASTWNVWRGAKLKPYVGTSVESLPNPPPVYPFVMMPSTSLSFCGKRRRLDT